MIKCIALRAFAVKLNSNISLRFRAFAVTQYFLCVSAPLR